MRTLTNEQDVARKFPTDKLAERVLLETEGAVIERLAGPGIAGKVNLSKPAVGVQYILVDDGAGAFAVGGVAPAALPVPVPGVHFTVVLNDNGVCSLTEANAREYTGLFLTVWYQRDEPEGTQTGHTIS